MIRVVIEKTFLARFRGNLPAKIFKISEKNPQKVRVSFYFDNLDFLNEWLLQFGNNVEIEEPKNLKVKREGLLREMLKK